MLKNRYLIRVRLTGWFQERQRLIIAINNRKIGSYFVVNEATMKTITLHIPDDKFAEIVRFCAYRKMTTGFNPSVDPLD